MMLVDFPFFIRERRTQKGHRETFLTSVFVETSGLLIVCGSIKFFRFLGYVFVVNVAVPN